MKKEGPQLQVPLAFAEHLVEQLRDAAREAGWESLLQDSEVLGELIARQFPEPNLLGRQVRVIRELETWAFAGGWGDGPQILHPGAKLYLEYERDGQVFFKGGSPAGTTGGKFRAEDLAAVEDDRACG